MQAPPLEPPSRRIRRRPSIPEIHHPKSATKRAAMSMTELVRLVAIRPTDAEPDKREQLEEKGEPRGRARAVVPTAAKEAAGRMPVERGVFGGEYGRVGRDRDHAGWG